MNLIIILIISFILIIYFNNLFVKRQKEASYLKAGKKWENIVNELRKRK